MFSMFHADQFNEAEHFSGIRGIFVTFKLLRLTRNSVHEEIIKEGVIVDILLGNGVLWRLSRGGPRPHQYLILIYS